jgi:hypothetical protein
MDCEQLAPLYEEYALGVLEGDERAEIEAHLVRGCPKCRRASRARRTSSWSCRPTRADRARSATTR